MKIFKLKRTTLALLGFAFVAVGSYNSLVINSDSFMDGQSVRFVKRLDEITGEVREGRKLANAGEWVKLSSPKKARVPSFKMDSVSRVDSSATAVAASDEVVEAPAAITEELSLELSEVFNAKKYPNGLKAGEFSGALVTNEGVIESMSVNLPNSESVSVSFSEMHQNVFTYEIDGEPCSGMIYQMDKNYHMVTLTNGPFEGTRLKFATTTPQEENFGNNSEEVAENNGQLQAEEAVVQEDAPQEFAAVINDNGTQTEVGTFGAENTAQPVENVEMAQGEMTPAPEGGYGFNF